MKLTHAGSFALAGVMIAIAGQPVRTADVLYVKAAKVIVDVNSRPPQPGAVVITDGVVTAAGANVTTPAGARQLDLGPLDRDAVADRRAYASWQAAARHRSPAGRRRSPRRAYAALRAQKSVDNALKLGVAAMRVLGTNDFLDVAIAQAIDDG